MRDRGHIERALTDHGSTHYIVAVGVFKGVSLASGAYALDKILGAPHGTGEGFIVALLDWTATFLLMILTYDAILVGSIVCFWRLNIVDIAIPFVSAVTEFSMFSILGATSWRTNVSAQLHHLGYWPLATAVLCGVSFVLVLNATINLRHWDKWFSDPADVKTAMTDYRAGLLVDLRASGILGLIAIIVYIIEVARPASFGGNILLIQSIIVIVVAIGGIGSQEKARWRLANNLGRHFELSE